MLHVYFYPIGTVRTDTWKELSACPKVVLKDPKEIGQFLDALAGISGTDNVRLPNWATSRHGAVVGFLTDGTRVVFEFCIGDEVVWITPESWPDEFGTHGHMSAEIKPILEALLQRDTE